MMIFLPARNAKTPPPNPADTTPHLPKKCIGRVKYFSRNQMVKMSNITGNVRLNP